MRTHKWKKERPQESGFYWATSAKIGEVTMFEVSVAVHNVLVDGPGFGDLYAIDDPLFDGAWWLGPIPIPPPPEGAT